MLRERICPEKRQERLNAIRNQTFICSIDKCDREFEFKQRAEFASHSLTAHCLILRQLVPNARPNFKNLDCFVLKPTALTKKAIVKFQASRAKYFHKLARNPTRRTADISSIKKVFYNNVTPKSDPLNALFNEEDTSELNDSSKRHLNQICARPMTPMSPSIQVTASSGEVIYNTASTDESLVNISNYIFIDSRNKTASAQNKDKIKSKYCKKTQKANDANKTPFKFSGECLSPSPSPTPSPSSKTSTSSLSLSTSSISNETSKPKPSKAKKQFTSVNLTENMNDLLCEYFKADVISAAKTTTNSNKNKVTKHLTHCNTNENVNSNNFTSLTNMILKPDLSFLEKIKEHKEYTRMKQRNFILSRLIYFKSNKAFRYVSFADFSFF